MLSWASGSRSQSLVACWSVAVSGTLVVSEAITHESSSATVAWWWWTSACWATEWTSTAHHWKSWREAIAWDDDGNTDDCAVELGLVHVCDGLAGIGLVTVENVSCATVYTHASVDWKVHVDDLAVHLKELAQVLLVDIASQFLYDNLCASWWWRWAARIASSSAIAIAVRSWRYRASWRH